MEIPQRCAWCINFGTSRCGRCRSVVYCCREHQISHWPEHKNSCRKVAKNVAPATLINPTFDNPQTVSNFGPEELWYQNNLPVNTSENLNVPMGASNIYNTVPTLPDQEGSMEYLNLLSDEEIFSSLSSELLSSDNNFWDLIDTNTLLPDDPDKEKKIANIDASLQAASSAFLSQNNNLSTEEGDSSFLKSSTFNKMCDNIVRDLNDFGICVLDNFIGVKKGSLVLDEVKNLYYKGIFKKGELAIQNPYRKKESVRSDVTTWVNGTESECTNIGNLMKKLDMVVTTCNKVKSTGLMSCYKLHRRTKAMIACYPGDGTHYKKHVDNPHGDGRCITCIYYLNKNWNVKKDGGMLRMFPEANSSHIANIEPIFDRMIFFWSDKRNPHEVLPAFQTRFAITVWYFDADERYQALMMSRKKATQNIKV
ncbi:egl nine homolog 1 [Caerostris extrusa]|uniref:hypoxia-inducible factor-proline dioxygenase n=1 Tax=Caerostris extrusa TaxID=172846 RepID=A0AAV4VHU2_CAEEX|nr:egl nine homolog 1 [Caerostris extrusa]